MSKAWGAVRWTFAALLVSLAVLIPVADLKVDEAAAMAALLVLALAVAALSPSASRRFGPRVQSLKVGGLLEIGLFEARQAAGREGDEDPVDPEAAGRRRRVSGTRFLVDTAPEA